MRIASILPLLGIALLANSPAGATPITYSLVNQGGGILLTGNIVTDGVIGTLSQSDIISWQITETGTSGPGIMQTINSTNSTISLTGSALRSDSTGLVFNFSNSAAAKLAFTSNQSFFNSVLHANEPAFQLTYCDTVAACKSPTNVAYLVQLILTNTTGSVTIGDRPTGTSPIARPVPLPASFTLFLSGLAVMVGLMLRQRTRRALSSGYSVARPRLL